MWGLSSGVGLTIQSFVGDGLEVAVTVFVGLDVHRAQITFDALDVDSGELQTGRVQPANRDTFRRFLARLDGQPLVAAVEAMTGWRLHRGGADACGGGGPSRRAGRDERQARAQASREDRSARRAPVARAAAGPSVAGGVDRAGAHP